MNYLTIILVITALLSSIAQIIDKKLVSNSITKQDYFYLMSLSMIPFASIMVYIEYINNKLRFDCSLILFILIVLAMVLRYVKQNSIVGSLKHLTPYENAAYMTTSIILAYSIDIFIGSKTLSYVAITSICLILCGVFCIANSKKRPTGLIKYMTTRIVATLLISYTTYYALVHISNALFILIVNLLLTIIFSGKYKINYYKENSNIIKLVFLQQSFGFSYLYLYNYLVSSSVTIAYYVQPTALIFLLLTATSSKEKPKMIQVIGIICIIIGLILI